jgi:hypothetical protein
MIKDGVITLHKGHHLWLADWSQTPEAASVDYVTGSLVVPTGYYINVPARVVCRSYSELNPGYLVIAEPEGGFK